MVLVLGILITLVVPAVTLPRLPHVNVWPIVIALLPYVLGKYLLCPLRWHAVTNAGLSRWWHTRAYAESELLGLLTPGHVGADAWRFHRLTRAGLTKSDSLTSIGVDRFIGAIGLAVFVGFAGSALPAHMLLVAFGVAILVVAAALVVRRLRPDLMPRRQALPRPRQLAHGLLLSAAYQLSIVALLLGALSATGHTLPPLELLGAFGASQLAGAVPGPNGASPRDGALVIALVALGVPAVAATAAVALKAVIAWLPALTLGGVSLVLTRRAAKLAAHGAQAAPVPAGAPA